MTSKSALVVNLKINGASLIRLLHLTWKSWPRPPLNAILVNWCFKPILWKQGGIGGLYFERQFKRLDICLTPERKVSFKTQNLYFYPLSTNEKPLPVLLLIVCKLLIIQLLSLLVEEKQPSISIRNVTTAYENTRPSLRKPDHCPGWRKR